MFLVFILNVFANPLIKIKKMESQLLLNENDLNRNKLQMLTLPINSEFISDENNNYPIIFQKKKKWSRLEPSMRFF